MQPEVVTVSAAVMGLWRHLLVMGRMRTVC